MTRGNQRDLARAKAQKKAADENKGQRSDGKGFGAAKEDDASKMRAKQAAAEEKKRQQEEGK